MAYEVKVRDVPAQKVMSVRFVTSLSGMSGDMGAAFQEIWDCIEKSGIKFAGEFFAVYHDENFNPDKIDVECCISVPEFLPESGRVKAREVEGGLMAATTHKGSYDTLEGAYTAILEWIGKNPYTPLFRMRDVYLNSPDEVPPEELLTEVLWPVARK